MLAHLYFINSEGPSTKSHAEFRKERGTREIKLPIFTGFQRKQGCFRKTSISVSLTMLKPLTVDHDILESS